MNKLGINLWNWALGLSDACCGLPTKAAKMGFTALELPMTQPTISPTLRDVRTSTMQYLTDCLQTGATLGAVVLAGPLYAGGGKRHTLPPAEAAREWELAVTGLQELSRRAEECGIRLALEPLNRYRTSVINTVEQLLPMLEDIGCDNVEEADLLASLETALKSGRVTHFHACANNRGAPGDGIVPWDAVMRLLQQYGYAGHITMETFAPGGLDASWVNVHGTPDEVALRGLHFLQRYF